MLSLRGIVTVIVGLVILFWYLPGALLCLWPGFMRVREGEEESSTGPTPTPAPLVPTVEELLSLGFRRLGVRIEGPPMRPGTRYLEMALPGEGTFASVFDDGGPLVTLTTPFEDGSFVVTADHRRPGIERQGRYLAGGIPGATPQELLNVHRRRVAELREKGKSPRVDATLKGVVEARQRLLRGVGAREIRQANATRLAVAIFALMFVISVLFGRPLGPGPGAVDATRFPGP